MSTVVVCDPIDPAGITVLRDAGCDVRLLYEESDGDVLSAAGDADALVVRSATKVTREVLEAGGDRLRAVGRAGVGLDNVDLEAARDLKVKVVNTPGATARAVAEHAIGLMFAMARRIPFLDRGTRAGDWPKKQGKGVELEGKCLGLVGLGNIGRETARLGRAVGMHLRAYDVAVEAGRDIGVTLEELGSVLEKADFLTIHVPLLDSTRHVIDEAALKTMKSTAYLVNCARGGVVDEEALAAALREGSIAGAALDVFEDEPVGDDHPLAGLDNVIFTPHVAGQTAEGQARAGQEVARRVLDALKGGDS